VVPRHGDPANDVGTHVAAAAVRSSASVTTAASRVSASVTQHQQLAASTTGTPRDPVTAITTAVSSPAAQVASSSAGNTPGVPPDTPVSWMMLAAARREKSGVAAMRSATAAVAVSTPLVSVAVMTNGSTSPVDPTSAVSNRSSAAAVVAQTTTPTTLTASFQVLVYTPVHTAVEAWIDSDLGQTVDGFINTLAGSYVIGNGAGGTAAHPAGGAGGWLLGDGGTGWDGTEAGVAGGTGGAAGWLGNGGAGGGGGAGSGGAAGGAGGGFMGIGGAGGGGGAGSDGGSGGAGGAGGAGIGLVFGVGGDGGHGGDGSDGGRGGDGGNGAQLLGSGGDGGDAGNSGVGGAPGGLPALGGAGGTAGWFGSHGAVGRSGLPAGGSSGAARVADGSVLPISTTGTRLTDSDGQVVILHGVNEVYKVAPYEPSADGFSDDDAAFLAANGFNAVRLGVIWAGVEPEPGVIDTAYLASIDQTVHTLANHGIYTIVDMHQDNYSSTFTGEGAPEWATQTGGLPNQDFGFPGSYYLNAAENHAWDAFWSNADAANGLGLEDNYAQAWESVASSLNGNPGVVGYDIINEPWPGSSWLRTLLGGSFFGDQQLAPMYNQVAAAIRAVDPTTALFVEPPNPGATEVGSILGAPVSLATVNDPNIVLAFHDYCGGLGPICATIADALADGAQKYAVQHNIPAFMDEFGATGDTSELTDEMQAGDQFQMSWTEWAYTAQGDITTSDTSGQEALVYDPTLPPVGDNVNTTSLATLAAPYPQVIAGTPKSWSFAKGTFQFSYSTEKADGSGSFPVASLTTISVPTVEFPNGYQVSVTGGDVVSARNAPQLIIVSDGAASTINLVVNSAAAGTGGGINA
jgi:endoglycosylceramidase